jgi:polysaccharide export outer membrane protein
MSLFVRIFLFVGVIGITSSCVNLKKVELLQKKSITNLDQEIKNDRGSVYKINSGDHLFIKVTSSDPQTSKFFQSDFPELMNPSYIFLNSHKVNTDGYVNYSFIDSIYVKGLTVEEARDEIQEALGKYFKDVNAFVKLVNFQITILGEVGSPGTYTIDSEEINILQALGHAKGINEFGEACNVMLVRKSPNGSIVKYIDITDNGLLKSDYFYLLPDDVLYVSTRHSKPFSFSKFPYGILFSVIASGLAIISLVK